MNKDFVIYDAEGNIVRTGNCPEGDLELQPRAGEFLLEASACCVNDAVDPVTREVICGGRKTPPAPPAPPLPDQPRLSTEQQLDLLWQAMDSGTFPKAEPFYSAIKAQKARQ